MNVKPSEISQQRKKIITSFSKFNEVATFWRSRSGKSLWGGMRKIKFQRERKLDHGRTGGKNTPDRGKEKAALGLFRERGPFGALKAEKGRGEGLKWLKRRSGARSWGYCGPWYDFKSSQGPLKEDSLSWEREVVSDVKDRLVLHTLVTHLSNKNGEGGMEVTPQSRFASQDAGNWLLAFEFFSMLGHGILSSLPCLPLQILSNGLRGNFSFFKKSSCSWTHSFQIWESILKNNNQCR